MIIEQIIIYASTTIFFPCIAAVFLLVLDFGFGFWLLHRKNKYDDFDNFDKIRSALVKKWRDALEAPAALSPEDNALLDLKSKDMRKFSELVLEGDDLRILESMCRIDCGAVYYPAGVVGAVKIEILY